jgi:hypothetical protein
VEFAQRTRVGTFYPLRDNDLPQGSFESAALERSALS